MAVGEAFPDAVAIAGRTPSLDLGVHLTLVEERPLLDPARIRSLVRSDGRLHAGAAQFAARYALGRIRFDEVAQEWKAQLDRVLAQGIRPSHLDSHQHLHLLPRVLDVALDLARRHGIRWIRVPAEAAPLRRLGEVPPGRVAGALALKAACALALRRVPTRPAGFAGFLESGQLTTERLRALVARLPQRGMWEIVCHPGMPDPATRYSHWSYHWAEELEALLDPGVASLIRERGFALTSFREVCP